MKDEDERKTPPLAFRPDTTERALLEALADRYGLSLSRAVGFAIRKAAESEGLREPARPLEEVKP